MFSFFWQFLKPYWGRIFFAVILTSIGSAIWLYNAYAFSQVVNFIFAYKPGDSFTYLYLVMGLWAGSVLISNIFGFLGRYIGLSAAEYAVVDAETFAIKHLSQLDIVWHEKENSGNKLKRIDRGARSLFDMVRMFLGQMVAIPINLIGALYIISKINIQVSGFLIIYLLAYYFISRFSRKQGVKALRAGNIKDEEITGLWYEIVANIRSVKVLGMTDKVLEYAKVITAEMLGFDKKRIFWFQGSSAIQGIWEGVVRIAFMAYIIWGILLGHYEVGFLVLFYGYFNTLSNSIDNLSNLAQDIATARTSIERFTDILDEPINVDNETGKGEFPQHWDAVHIKDLSFNYGDNLVLNNISFDINKGEKVGIVGLSGAGKSTIFKLLLKEYENYEGEILIGHTPLKTIKKSSYVSHIAAVLQETEVFNMSLQKNIVLANSAEENDTALFERSLDIAHVRDFLPKLPQGVETLIGEKGIKLSGGEKQRLGIARAVFKKPEILFLDEATSHLDIESEQKIQDSLKKFFKDVTAVVIAHRLSTIREMDRIIVIEAGKIIETGTFDELHANDGRFRDFWDKQRK